MKKNHSQAAKNLKRNWYFPISAMAFFCLNVTLARGYFVGVLIAFFASLVIASQVPSLFDLVKKNHIGLHIVAVMTALGICWGGKVSLYERGNASPIVQALKTMLPMQIDIINIAGIFGAVVAVFFVYFFVLLFWNKMTKIISDNGLFSGVNLSERIVYSILIIASLALVFFSFAHTEAFYGTEYAYDIIYTSDSPSLVKSNAYLVLAHPENDIRQPLFAVFASPFIGIPYLLGKIFGASASVQAMMVNMVQVIMLFTANFMLAKMMKLNLIKRVCFILLTSCT